MITVDVRSTVRKTDPRIIGMNTNFLTDHAVQRQAGQGLEAALRQMGVRSLRYPGGEKSDEFFWSLPPWTAPQPTLALTGPKGRLSPMIDYVENLTTFRYKPLDFDEFVTLCQRLDAEPIVCVNFDSMYLPPVSDKGIAPTKAQLLEHAVEWVRYANVTRGYGVRYWELGNESYIPGGNGSAKAADYARDFVEFAQAMKAVEPTIQIGANGPGEKNGRAIKDMEASQIGLQTLIELAGQGEKNADALKGLEDSPIWWQTLLERAGSEIDFMVAHPYPCFQWGSYDYYITHTPDFTSTVDEAIAALDEWATPEDAARIRVFSTETNAADWAASDHFPDLDGWPLDNDLGHALVLFEILGQHLLHPRVDMAEVWNTRWVHPEAKSLWNTLDENNALNATGQAIVLWGKNLETDMVQTTSTDTIRTFASYNPTTQALSVFLINKARKAQKADVKLLNDAHAWKGICSALTGTDSEDQAPTVVQMPDLSCKGGQFELTLDPVSITVVALKPHS